MTDPVFHPGQKITPVYTNGYDITALAIASAEMWRGKPVWVYRGTDVQEAITEFRKILEK